MSRPPHLVSVGREVASLPPRVLALVMWDDGARYVRGVLSIDERVVFAATRGDRAAFLRELGRELCRVGMHRPTCFHVKAGE